MKFSSDSVGKLINYTYHMILSSHLRLFYLSTTIPSMTIGFIFYYYFSFRYSPNENDALSTFIPFSIPSLSNVNILNSSTMISFSFSFITNISIFPLSFLITPLPSHTKPVLFPQGALLDLLLTSLSLINSCMLPPFMILYFCTFFTYMKETISV